MSLRYFFAVVLGMTCIVALAAAVEIQKQHITGTIVDAETQQPIPNTRVWIHGTEIESTSDTWGEFELSEAPDRPFILRVDCWNYYDVSIRSLVPGMEQSNLEIRLHRVEWLDEDDDIDMRVTKANTRPVLTVDELLQQVAGIQISTKGEIFIRGCPGGEVTYTVDVLPAKK